MLSRQAMVDTIKNGGSVLINGRLVTRVENLPSAADLAQTDEEKAAAEQDIDAQIEKLQSQKAKVGKKSAGKNLGEGKGEDKADKAPEMKPDKDAK